MNIEIYDRIEQIRRSLKLNKNKFCEIIGINPSAYYRYKVDGYPSLKVIIKIAELSKRSADYILFGKDCKEGTYIKEPTPQYNAPSEIIEEILISVITEIESELEGYQINIKDKIKLTAERYAAKIKLINLRRKIK